MYPVSLKYQENLCDTVLENCMIGVHLFQQSRGDYLSVVLFQSSPHNMCYIIQSIFQIYATKYMFYLKFKTDVLIGTPIIWGGTFMINMTNILKRY